MSKLSWQDVHGWFDWQQLYDEVAMTTPPYSTVVEVGVAFGRSLLYLAEKIRETGKPGIKLVAVDLWEPYPEAAFIWNERPDMPPSERAAFECVQKHGGYFPAFLHNVYESGFANDIHIMRRSSVQAALAFTFCGTDVRPHFVFVDAAHDYVNCRRDIDYWWDTGCEWIAGHDYNRGSEIHFPGVWKAVDEKWGGKDRQDVEKNIEWRGQTCFVVRRAHMESLSR